MRLICPNCGAQYEVDDSLIPENGRDVQCSNCGHAWFQRSTQVEQDPEPEPSVERRSAAGKPAAASSAHWPEDSEAEAPPQSDRLVEDHGEGRDEPTPATAGPRPKMDDSVRQVLAEEGEREVRARRADAGIETQGDLGLDAPQKADGARRGERPRDTGVADEEVAGPTKAGAVAAGAVAAGSRREMLPDIEEINSTLRSAEERDGDTPPAGTPVRRRGFGLGFSLVLIVAILCVVVYVTADQIGQAIPAAEPALNAYVDEADALRGWLDGLAQDWIHRVQELMRSARTETPN